MGAQFKIVLYSTDEATARRASRAAFDRIAALDAILSDYEPESELSRLLRSAGGPPVPVSADLFDVLDASRRMYERSRRRLRRDDRPGGPALAAGPPRPQAAGPRAARRGAALVGSDKMGLDRPARTVQLEKPGMKLDVGGIAKGYAVPGGDRRAQAPRASRVPGGRRRRHRRWRPAARCRGLDDRDRPARARPRPAAPGPCCWPTPPSRPPATPSGS